MRDGEITLTEIAPGVDVDAHILAQMDFAPKVAADLKTMDERIFGEERMGLDEV